MNVLAQTDTWGISGPVFIRGYVFAAVAIFVCTLFLRRWARRGRSVRRALHPYEVAYLAAGPLRALAAVVAALRADGAIDVERRGRLRRTGQAPSMTLTPLDHAVLLEIQRGMPLRKLISRSSVRQALKGLREGLVRDGLMPGAVDKAQLRLATSPMLVLLAVGLARLVAGLNNGRPVAYLAAALIAVGVTTLILLLRSPRTTAAGQAALQDARSGARHLDPAMSPAWATYGPAGAALGVALFGAAALMSLDPGFVREGALLGHLGLASGVTSYGSSATYGGSSSSSCSGASSCSGGSSCGGGGGGGGGGGCGG